MDPQGAVATAFAYAPDLLSPTLYEVFFGGAKTEETIIAPERVPNIHILPSNLSMAEGEVRLISEMECDYFLQKALHSVLNKLLCSPASVHPHGFTSYVAGRITG